MTESSPLRARGGLIDALSSTVDRGGHGLTHTPALLRRVLEEQAWREFETVRGEHVTHADFLDFVTTPPLKGLGATVDLVRRLIADDQTALDLLNEALDGSKDDPRRSPVPQGGSEMPEGGVTLSVSATQAAALRRLSRDAPELHQQVIAGHLSANAAMIQAGFRARTVSIPISRPESAARALRRKLNADELAQLIKLLSEED
ncbi:hypothetical protein [Saccharothrix sp.]|uniref:hypothetical protein n=1 Tax=Saccharothrix sp. TaxID=1873460 RepID=UPI002810A7BC|nr:hypothetical protein [Saccharothrix sp.]